MLRLQHCRFANVCLSRIYSVVLRSLFLVHQAWARGCICRCTLTLPEGQLPCFGKRELLIPSKILQAVSEGHQRAVYCLAFTQTFTCVACVSDPLASCSNVLPQSAKREIWGPPNHLDCTFSLCMMRKVDLPVFDKHRDNAELLYRIWVQAHSLTSLRIAQ